MKAVAEGDSGALADLYDRHGGAVFALCLRMLRDAEEAEEVLEDVFWHLWRHAGRYDPARGSVIVYLVTLARSRSLDRLRARERRVRLRNEVADSTLTENLVGSAAGGSSPFGDTLANERRGRVRGALAELSPEQREAVELAFLEGLTHLEISLRLGQPLGTIKTRIRSALLRLRGALGGSDGGRS
ncbi:MAG TPA: sigma-70 family RNA polymerase sigma factor [Myxococcota bacterium]|nr:sigma-70 family RNA polymerase sigma factor [Myxococcota bacterium]